MFGFQLHKLCHKMRPVKKTIEAKNFLTPGVHCRARTGQGTTYPLCASKYTYGQGI